MTPSSFFHSTKIILCCLSFYDAVGSNKWPAASAHWLPFFDCSTTCVCACSRSPPTIFHTFCCLCWPHSLWNQVVLLSQLTQQTSTRMGPLEGSSCGGFDDICFFFFRKMNEKDKKKIFACCSCKDDVHFPVYLFGENTHTHTKESNFLLENDTFSRPPPSPLSVGGRRWANQFTPVSVCKRWCVYSLCAFIFLFSFFYLFILFFSFLVTSMRREKSIPPHFPLCPLPRVSMCVCLCVCVSECVCVRRVTWPVCVSFVVIRQNSPISGSNFLAAKNCPQITSS